MVKEEMVMTPAQRGRKRRNEAIVGNYEKLKTKYPDMAVTQFCHEMAKEFFVSWQTVYNLIRDYENGREATNDDDGQ